MLPEGEGNKVINKKDFKRFTQKVCNNTINFLQWNARSLSTHQKLNFLRGIPSSIITVQEYGNPHNLLESSPFNVISKMRSDNKGGGTALLFNDIDFEIIKTIQVNQDTCLYRVVLNKLRIVWLSSIYLNRGSISQIQALFSCISSNVPPEEWQYLLLMGDFNVDLCKEDPKKKLISDLSKQFKLTIAQPCSQTRGESCLDFAIHGSSINPQCISTFSSPSDHKAILWSVSISTPTRKKTQRIPNRKTADQISLHAVKSQETCNASDVLKLFQKLRRKNKRRWWKLIRNKPKTFPYFKFLLSLKEDDNILKESRLYWENFWLENETKRFSPKSKEAFAKYKTILKYHNYEKKDGSIVSCLKQNDGTIVHDPKEVSKALIESLKQIQFKEECNPPQTLTIPKLPDLSMDEMKGICNCLSTKKAISFDLFSDVILSDEEAFEATCKKLSDLWSCDLDVLAEELELWCGRVIPLNKIHPHIPDSTQFRPIVVMSILLKIMESRFLPKLNEYLSQKLISSQTGFVEGQGIFVNLYRAISRIKARISNSQYPFALFVDFKSAYNHVNHDILFQRLKGILSDDDISFLKAIYSRLNLRIGDEKFHPSKGVAQGSIISPALFNIYLEPLLHGFNAQCGVDITDIFGYADDVMIICDSKEQLEKCIQYLEEWAQNNGLPINHAKSGIVHFQNRLGPNLQTPFTALNNFEVKPQYQYLGCVLDRRLSLNPQLRLITKKSNFIFHRLNPALYSGSFGLRRNLWQCFIQPLFEFTLPLLSFDQAQTNLQKLHRLVRKTMKSFLYLSKTTKNEDLHFLMSYDITQRERYIKYVSQNKWEYRLGGKIYDQWEDPNACALRPKKVNLVKDLPKEISHFSNLLCALCPKCDHSKMSSEHLRLKHGLKVENLRELVKKINLVIEKGETRTPRKQKLEKAKEIVVEKIGFLKAFMRS